MVFASFITSYSVLVLGASGCLLLQQSILLQNFLVLIPTLRKLCMGLHGLIEMIFGQYHSSRGMLCFRFYWIIIFVPQLIQC